MLEDEFADIIKKARAGLGLSLAGAAQSSGIALSDLKELESGIRVFVEQIRHDARVALGWVLRHGVAPFRLAHSKLSEERIESVNVRLAEPLPATTPDRNRRHDERR